MSKWIFYFGLVGSLPASSIYWSSPTASPSSLGLDGVLSVNDSGIAVGSAGGQAAETSVTSPGVVLLGLPALYSTATAINGSGQIAGTYENASGDLYAFFWSASTGMAPLGTLGGTLSDSLSIDSAGQIVGQTLDGAGNLSAFLWSSGSGMSKIGDSISDMATFITVTGQIAYQEDPFPYWNNYAAVGDVSSPSILDFGGAGSYISAMNNAGWIVGYTTDGDGFVSTPGGIINFGTAFLPKDINNADQVIGAYQGQPALWTESGGFELLSTGGFSDVSVMSINDEGQIVGNAAPVPEPSSLVLCLLGVLLLAAGWRGAVT